MADFVAVIRRAVDGLPENTPENRERVYAKARGAVRRQLENMSPRPSEDVFRKQLERLDAAISEVEIEHTEALPPEEDVADEALPFAGPEPEADAPAHREDEPEDRRDEDESGAPRSRLFTAPIVEDGGEATDETRQDTGEDDGADDLPAPSGWRAADDREPDADDPSSPFGDEPLIGDAHDEVFGLGAAAGSARRKRRRRGRQLAVALVILLVVTGAAYALWENRTSVLPMIASLSSLSGPAAPSSAAKTPAPNGTEKEVATTPPPGKVAPLPADAGNDKSASDAADKAKADLPPGGKYTQRLLADGTETNPGPAAANEPATPAGGKSISEQTAEAPAAADAGQQPDAADASPSGAGEAAKPAEISQKMYLYEERYKTQEPTAATGTVVWSLAKDTSDGSGAKTPVIHGEISVPDKGITALVTIKRNNDPSLPASHLIEVVFALPGKFEGGGIQSVERVSMKETEQARGDPLIAVPAKITDNFFMIALNDYPQAVKTNLDLLKSREWIDIPMTYDNGRRALITLDKGASGAEVFDKALAAWAQAGDTPADSDTTGAAGGASGGGASDSGGKGRASRTPTSVPPKSPTAQKN